jgi:hypothetical protein
MESTPTSTKRTREADEISPNTEQKSKEVRKMTSTDEKLDMILKEIADIKRKIEPLDTIRADVEQIKQENAEFRRSLAGVEGRVREVEDKVDEHVEKGGKTIEELKHEIGNLDHRLNYFEQQTKRNVLTIRNLPKEIQKDRKNVPAVLKTIFDVIKQDVTEGDYDAYPVTAGKNAGIRVTFTTNKMKENVLDAFKAMCTQASKEKNAEPPHLVEKIVALPVDHELNGKKISMSNWLTTYNLKLLEYARKFVPKHFQTAKDMSDCAIKVKTSEGWRAVSCVYDIDELVSKSENALRKGNQRGKKASNPASSPKITRSSAKKNKD